MNKGMVEIDGSLVEKLGKVYGLNVRDVKPIERGEVNRNFEVYTCDDRFFLREYGDGIIRNEEDLIFEHRVLNHLTCSGFSRLARPISVKNLNLEGTRFPCSTIVSIDGRYYALFEFIDGRDAGHRDLEEAAWTLGCFHNTIENFGHSWRSFFIENLWERELAQHELRLACSEKRDFFIEVLAELLPRVEHYLHRFNARIRELDSRLKKLTCHNDYHLGNVRMNSGRAYITDFEGVACNYRAYEVAFAVVAFCTQEDPGDLREEKGFWAQAGRFFKSYINASDLHTVEIELMPSMITATYIKLIPRIIRHHFEGTHETDKRIRDETLITIANSFDWCEEYSSRIIADLRAMNR